MRFSFSNVSKRSFLCLKSLAFFNTGALKLHGKKEDFSKFFYCFFFMFGLVQWLIIYLLVYCFYIFGQFFVVFNYLFVWRSELNWSLVVSKRFVSLAFVFISRHIFLFRRFSSELELGTYVCKVYFVETILYFLCMLGEQKFV